MYYKLISIKFGDVRPPPQEQRCKRRGRITLALFSFDLGNVRSP